MAHGAGYWRAMRAEDLPAVQDVAVTVHPAYPEDVTVVAERLRLYPAGCLVLDVDGAIRGYALSHPWRLGEPPKLNVLLERLPQPADTYYIHDLAVIASARGSGVGNEAVSLLVAQAARSGTGSMSLVAVGGSEGFWRKAGFAVSATERPKSLDSYDTSAQLMVRQLPKA